MSGKMIRDNEHELVSQRNREMYQGDDRNSNVSRESNIHTGADNVFTYEISEQWAHLYQGVEVALVTNIEKPVRPPQGYVPLRRGILNQSDASEDIGPQKQTKRFSLDTFMWTESLLEERLEERTAWKRRPSLTLRDKLDQINWLIKSK